MIAFLKLHKPAVMQLENVEEVALNETELKFLASALHKVGYVLIYDIIKSRDYGFPQNRTRFFGLALCVAACNGKSEKDVEFLGKSVFALQRKMWPDPMPMNYFVLPDSDPYIAGEMQRRKTQASQGTGADTLSWVKQHQKVCTTAGLPLKLLIPPVDQEASSCFSLLTKREREVLGFNINDSRSRNPPKELGFIDVSQSINRAPASEPDVVPNNSPQSQ